MENTGEVKQIQSSEAIAVTEKPARRDSEEFDAIKEVFADWLARPEELRDPVNQKEFGKKYQVHQSTLTGWKATPEFQAKVIDLVRRYALYDFADYMGFLKKEAAAGNTRAIELYFKFIHNYRERFDIAARHDHSGQIDVLVDGKPAQQLPVGLVRTNVSEMRN